MRKFTQKEIRGYVQLGLAKDITWFSWEQAASLNSDCNLEKVGYSSGVYGINGALLQDRDSGEMYAIYKRNTALLTLC